MSKNKAIVAIIFAIISFFVFRHCIRVGTSMVEIVSSSVLYPLLRIQKAIIVPIAQWFEHHATIGDLEKTIQQLYQENEKLLAHNIALQSLQSYAQDTRELRDFNKRYAVDHGYIAQILVRHFSPTNQFFLVDAGSSQGIKKDMVALYGNNILGKVTEVYPWYCKICLITDADCKVSVLCLSSKAMNNNNFKGSSSLPDITLAAAGISEGINDISKTVMRYVSHLESIEVGDLVISSGEGLVFPKGFALGTIISAEKGELFYSVSVKPLVDFHTLQYCNLTAKQDT